MAATLLDDIAAARAACQEVIERHLWVVATPILVESEGVALSLLRLGARRVMCVGVTEGVRLTPAPLEHEGLTRLCLSRHFEGGDLMTGIRAGEAALDALPQEALAALDAFDPVGEALALRTIFSTSPTLAGRRVFGARPPSWVALEDKLVVDQLWDEAGVRRAPSRIVALEEEALLGAWEALGGVPVVVAGDNRAGWHGGASRTRWARTPAELSRVARELGAECERARVMPFLEGISCSIHAWVSPEGAVVSFRPCEMLVTPSAETRFEYLGAATSWRPSGSIATEMRRAAERVARHLRDRFGYRGSFTVDGVATAEGFFPTELNPRFGGALGRMSLSLPDLPLLLMHFLAVEGYPIGLSLEVLRARLVEGVEASPVVRGMRELSEPCATPTRAFARLVEGRWCRHAGAEGSDAELTWGSALHGSLVFCVLRPGVVPPGEVSLPFVLGALGLAREVFLGEA